MIFKSEKLKDKAVQKIVFLLILVLCVLAAKMLVSVRHRIKLFEPEKLLCADITVKLPTGSGWRAQTDWVGDKRGMYIGAAEMTGANQNVAVVRWIYHYDQIPGNIEEYLADVAKIGTLENKTTQTFNGLDFTWIELSPKINDELQEIRKYSSQSYSTIAVTILDDGRWLELKIESINPAREYRKLLKSLLDSISYSPDTRLAEGIGLVRQIKANGLDRYINSGQVRETSLIKKISGQLIGFSASYRSYAVMENGLEAVKFNDVQYLDIENRKLIRNDILTISRAMDAFNLRSKVSSELGRIGQYIEMSFDGSLLTVKDLNSDDTLSFVPGRATINSQLGNELSRAYIHSNMQDTVIVDILYTGGRVVPTQISKEKINETGGLEYKITFKTLDGSSGVQELYFTATGQLIKQVDPKRGIATESADIEKISQIYPMWKSLLENISTENIFESSKSPR